MMSTPKNSISDALYDKNDVQAIAKLVASGDKDSVRAALNKKLQSVKTQIENSEYKYDKLELAQSDFIEQSFRFIFNCLPTNIDDEKFDETYQLYWFTAEHFIMEIYLALEYITSKSIETEVFEKSDAATAPVEFFKQLVDNGHVSFAVKFFEDYFFALVSKVSDDQKTELMTHLAEYLHKQHSESNDQLKSNNYELEPTRAKNLYDGMCCFYTDKRIALISKTFGNSKRVVGFNNLLKGAVKLERFDTLDMISRKSSFEDRIKEINKPKEQPIESKKPSKDLSDRIDSIMKWTGTKDKVTRQKNNTLWSIDKDLSAIRKGFSYWDFFPNIFLMIIVWFLMRGAKSVLKQEKAFALKAVSKNSATPQAPAPYVHYLAPEGYSVDKVIKKIEKHHAMTNAERNQIKDLFVENNKWHYFPKESKQETIEPALSDSNKEKKSEPKPKTVKRPSKNDSKYTLAKYDMFHFIANSTNASKECRMVAEMVKQQLSQNYPQMVSALPTQSKPKT